MGNITTLFVRKVIAAASGDLDQTAVLRDLGLTTNETDVKTMIPDADYYALLERIVGALGDATDFPLRVGASMRCDDYGAFGLAWKTAPTLRGSLERAARYARLLTSVAGYEVRNHDAGAYFLLQRDGPRTLGMRLSNEATLASALSIMREVSPAPVAPLEVHCRHAAPTDTAAHEAFFGCPVIFGSDLDGLLMSAETLARDNRLGDPAIAQFLRPHLDAELAVASSQTSFIQTLLRRMSDRLSEGPPRAADMAREMGMSERTLHRRLASDGMSFQSILEQARRQLAEGLLVQSDHSIAEIAFLTGYSEQSAFTRAFKRWVDQTPAAFRHARPGR
ncbi:transcriptional regulator, AraC family [Roseovarius lutimaris]|uniref:Transcriptional regulator, AraC family n=1 Tax=Roseovarius lutimaris TaxID=1005928 RepID=A0A1I4ZGU8_9RHOB|nr:AraC family transcriptional regulator [Roseovarius lutimaris]SFN49491.1 transcriptional regulator, AraC family [Roseovarius lutimaris]